jgi:thiamine kinase-like enzyme
MVAKNKLITYAIIMITAHIITPSHMNAGTAEHHKAIHSIIKNELKLGDPQDIKPLSGGFSSPGMYKVTAAGRAYVVRFSHEDWKLADRTREIDAMKIASSKGLAPEVFFSDAKHGVVVMEYLPKQDPPQWLNMTDDYLQMLASRMRTLHEGPAFKSYISIFDDIRSVGATIVSDPLNIISQSLKLNTQLEKELKPHWQSKPCHNDLHPDNTIENGGQIYFIDWEEAGPSDPFRDLATYAMFCGMKPGQEIKLLTYYLGRKPNKTEEAKYHQVKRVVLIYYGLVMIMLSQKQGLAMPTEEEINSLPAFHDVNPSQYFKNGYTHEILRFAFICLKEANAPNH